MSAGRPVHRPPDAGRFAGHAPEAGHDTGGLPWAGREVTASPFAGDDGAPDPRVRAALAAAAGAQGAGEAMRAEGALVDLLGAARLLVPIVAEATETTTAPGGGALPVDARSDMASVVLTAPDGRRAMPAFTGLDALTAWDAAARPVPVTGADAARAALDQGCEAILLDLGSPAAGLVRSGQLWALAQERPWRPPAADPLVRGAIEAFVAAHDPVRGAAAADTPGLLRLTLTLAPGLPPERVQALAAALGDALAADPEVRSRIDGVALTIAPPA